MRCKNERSTARFRNARLPGLLLAISMIGCGGDMTAPPPPGPDFSVSVSPVSASAVLGNVTSAITISVASQNEFNNSVNVVLQGIPQGVSSIPSSSFSLKPGAGQAVTFLVSASAPVGTFSIMAVATSGLLSHSAPLMLTTEPIVTVRTFQIGSLLYLESSTGTDIARVGIETRWGGSIVEITTHLINALTARLYARRYRRPD